MRTLEDVHAFIREHPEFGYQSFAEIEREMDVADERISLDLDERILPWITILLERQRPATS